MAYRNIRLHPALRLIYLLLRILVWVSVRVFYRRRLVLGREHLRFDGPAIVITNHPSTLMDVLNPAVEIRQEMFFLANYGLFKNPVTNWLFRLLYCIPVKRREDVTAGEERNNYEAFEQSFRHLEQYGVLFIAPEGTSWINRFVRPIKTGTARIAFGAESRNNWQLDLKIMPVGLSYSAPDRFRSDVVVQFGAPVYPRDWADAWARSRPEAVDALTAYLEEQLKALSIHTRDEAGEQLITRLEEILHNEQPLPQVAEFERSQLLVKTVLDNSALRTQTGAYFQALQQHLATDAAVAASRQNNLRRRWWGDVVLLTLGLPLFAAGYAFWFLPCFLPAWANKKMGLYIGYSSTVKILLGLFTIPLALWGAFRLALLWSHSAEMAGLALAVLVVLAGLVEQYQDCFKRYRVRSAALRLQRTDADAIQSLQQQRSSILAALNNHD